MGVCFQSIKVYTSTVSRFYLLQMRQLHMQRVVEVKRREDSKGTKTGKGRKCKERKLGLVNRRKGPKKWENSSRDDRSK